MEQLLNLVWLVIAAAGICGWLRMSTRARTAPRRVGLLWQLMAVSLVLVMLFFVISITDDLNQTQMTAEALEGSRKVLRSAASSLPGTAPLASVLPVVTALALQGEAGLRIISVLPARSIGSPAAGFLVSSFGRPPPSAS